MLDKFVHQSVSVTTNPDLQLKLADNRGIMAVGKDNCSGKKLNEVSAPVLSKRRLLVALDLLCLFLGKQIILSKGNVQVGYWIFLYSYFKGDKVI